MTRKRKYDWITIKNKVTELVSSGVTENKIIEEAVGIPRSSLWEGLRREFGIKDLDELICKNEEPEDKFSEKRWCEPDNNEETFFSESENIKSVAELIASSNIDMTGWIITKEEVKTYTIPMKLRRSKPTQVPGVFKIYHVPYEIRVYYVSFTRVPENPLPLLPIITPIEIIDTITIPKPKKTKNEINRGLTLADPQFGFNRDIYTGKLSPFHDRRVLDVVLQICEDEKFDYFALIGDGLDLSEWSTKYLQEPGYFWTTQPALLECFFWLKKFREALPDAEMDFFEGNHDIRPEKAMKLHLKAALLLKAVDEIELPDSMSIPRLLALHQLHINYIDNYPDAYKWLNDNTVLRHGNIVRANPGDTSKAIANKHRYVTISGHNHRGEMVTVRSKTVDGDIFSTSLSVPCACHIDGRVPGSTSESQWQQGFGRIDYTKTSETVFYVPIREGRCIYNNKEYIARDVDKEIDSWLNTQLETISGKMKKD